MINSKWRINGTSLTCYVLIFYSIWKSRWKSPLSFYFYFLSNMKSNITPWMLFPNMCDGMISVCSVKVIDLSIRQQIWSLQGHHFPRFTQSSVSLSPSPPPPPPVPLRSNYYPPGNKSIQQVISFIVLLSSLIGWDCEKLKPDQDPRIHMEMWDYK